MDQRAPMVPRGLMDVPQAPEVLVEPEATADLEELEGRVAILRSWFLTISHCLPGWLRPIVVPVPEEREDQRAKAVRVAQAGKGQQRTRDVLRELLVLLVQTEVMVSMAPTVNLVPGLK